MCSLKNRASSISHLAISFRALLLLLLLVLHPGSSLQLDADRNSCIVPRSLGCVCNNEHQLDGELDDQLVERTDITCDGLPLTEVPRNFSSPDSLRMRSTQLQLREGVPYRSLTDLRIEHNAIPYISDGAFEQLDNLITLILVDDQIRVLTGRTFAGLKSLEFLSLEGNTIGHIKAEVFSGLNMPNLKILKLSNCGISSLDSQSFSGLQQLALLDISSNQIERLPILGDSSGLPSLTSLELSNNRLNALNGSAFQHLAFVHHLYLSHNRIYMLFRNSFPRNMRQTLLSLHLRYNGLEVVEAHAIGQLESLTTLDISFNNLRTLDPDDIPDNAEKILIHDNPWTCMNCENRWILENPNVKNWNEESPVICSSWPYKGRSFFSISLPSDCDQRPELKIQSTLSIDAEPRCSHLFIWISAASLSVTGIVAAILIYVRCIRNRCQRQTSKANIKGMTAAESKQCLVIYDDNEYTTMTKTDDV